MRQGHLEQIVVDAVLALIHEAGFQVPRARQDEDPDGKERKLLRRDIKGSLAWLNAVQKEAKRRRTPDVLARQERIVLPRIETARKRIEALEELDPVVQALADTDSSPVRDCWDSMPLAQQRHVVQALVLPRIAPVSASERGQRGINASRVGLIWR